MYTPPPNAAQSTHLLKNVVARHGKPKYIAIDRGPEFQGSFEKAARKTRSQIRHGSAGKTTEGEALLERATERANEDISVAKSHPPLASDSRSGLFSSSSFPL